jgi:FkbM family methyltransferase
MDDIIRNLWKINLPGRRGLWRKRLIYRKLFGPKRIKARTKHDVIMMLDPAEIVDGDILIEGYWEPEVLDAIVASLREGDVFWDIGGNLGTHSLTVKKLMPSVQVIAFEPNPIMHSSFESHANLNGLDINILKVGLSDKESEAEFFVYTGLNYGKSGLQPPSDSSCSKSIRVDLKMGDDLVRKGVIPAPHVIKIDVEGHEQSVFRGMKDLLGGDTLRTIILEDVPEPGSPVKKLLGEYGFRFRKLDPPAYMVHSDYNDYVAEKK